jgi:hypothetical protein
LDGRCPRIHKYVEDTKDGADAGVISRKTVCRATFGLFRDMHAAQDQICVGAVLPALLAWMQSSSLKSMSCA